MTPTEAARLMARYAKSYHVGAFGTPLAKELEANPRSLRQWSARPGTHCVAVVQQATRDLWRHDWTGRAYRIPKGASVASSIAHTCNAPIPEALNGYDFLLTYAEDPLLTEACTVWRRPHIATRISASSEIITCWGPRGTHRRAELPADRLTMTELPERFDPELPLLRRELADIDTWHDDYPFYSDGSWGAVNLRGFKPDDPLWGVKPAEMPRRWQREHPEAMHYSAAWTSITELLPAMRALIEGVPWWRNLERVRLMRMAAKPGGGHLARHSDITDRSAGTRDGAIARFHLPLVTHPDITMTCWELDGSSRTQHLEAGHVYYLDQRKPHAVDNPTTVDRVHLVADVIVDPDVRAHLETLA